MATLPSLLALRGASSFSRAFNVSQIRAIPPQCSRRHSLDDSVSTPQASTSASGEQLGRGLDGRRAGCVLGLGAFAGSAMALFPAHAIASEIASNWDAWSSLVASEPKNALSLPTWVIHVASVAEWVTAMVLVWRYGDTPGNSTWKGLSWGMVPLLGGAMCACTWHFFYNAQSLEILVILQAAFTVIGNFTMWIAAFRIYQSSQKQSKAP